MTEKIDECLDAARQWSVLVDALLSELLIDKLSHVHVQKRARVKSKKSLIKKIDEKKRDKQYSLTDVTDVVGFRFVCHFQNEVEQVVDALLEKIKGTNTHKEFDKLIEARIYVSSAPNQQTLRNQLELLFSKHKVDLKIDVKDSRYTSVHMVVLRKDNQKFEIQVRNVFEDAWAEIEHALKYKNGQDDLSPSADRHLQVLNTFVQACSEYSEKILLDSIGETHTNNPIISELFDDAEELKKMPSDVSALIGKTTKLREQLKYKEAITVLSDFIANHDSRIKSDGLIKYYILMERGLCYLKTGKIQAAINDYSELKNENSNRALIYFRLADAYRIIKDFHEAIKYLELIPSKIASEGNTKQERDFLRKVPFTEAHSYWRLKEPEKSLEILDEAKKSGMIPWKGGEMSFINCYAYYQIEVAKLHNSAVSAKSLDETYNALLKMAVKSGNFWAELDTFMMICDLLGKDKEAIECAKDLSNMLTYEAEGEPPKIKLANGHTFDVPLEEIEIVRSHVDRILKNAAK